MGDGWVPDGVRRYDFGMDRSIPMVPPPQSGSPTDSAPGSEESEAAGRGGFGEVDPEVEVDRLSRILRTLSQQVATEDVREVLDLFEEKLREVRESTPVRKVDRGLRRARLFYEMLTAWWREDYPLPWRTVSALSAALLYFINPMDVVPDFLFMVGLVDDATVLYLCYRWMKEDLHRFVEQRGLNPEQYGLFDSDEPEPAEF